jgi:plasmid stabilization system protein ParE
VKPIPWAEARRQVSAILMGAKRLNIHPAALEELKSALVWYLERSETAANNFAGELDTAIDLIVNSPRRWPRVANTELENSFYSDFRLPLSAGRPRPPFSCWPSPTVTDGQVIGKSGSDHPLTLFPFPRLFQ